MILIRQGESEYNRAMVEGKDFKDPMIFDPALTAKGFVQVRNGRTISSMKMCLPRPRTYNVALDIWERLWGHPAALLRASLLASS